MRLLTSWFLGADRVFFVPEVGQSGRSRERRCHRKITNKRNTSVINKKIQNIIAMDFNNFDELTSVLYSRVN